MGDLAAMEEQRWPTLEETFDIETFDTIAESAAAYVTRAQWWDREKSPVVIKSGSIDHRFSKQPHDIGKELRILSSLSNFNIIVVLGHTFESPTSTLHYWMPWIPFHLSDILSSPYLVPHVPPGSGNNQPGMPSFMVVMKSLVYQTLTALAYLHEREIAHRDVKPRNILLTQDGCIKLADFGVAWVEQQNGRDLWPEPRGKMCFDVATGPYCAPELLFGTADYNACAIDLWSMGAILAEFFTPLRLRRTYEDEDDWYHDYGDDVGSDSEECHVRPPFIVPKGLSPDQRDVEWTRESLYDASRGQIGLAWSIFKVHGTPTEETWPMFKQLPDAQKVAFMQVPPVDLPTLLPNLPPTKVEPERENCLDLVRNFLTYPPDQRMRATDALKHRLFTDGLPLLFPPGYPDGHGHETWDDRGLADILSQYLGKAEGHELKQSR